MKKLFLFFTVIGMLSFGVSTNVKAQEGAETTEIADTTQVLADTGLKQLKKPL